MSAEQAVAVKPLAALTVATLQTIVPGFDSDIGSALQPLYPQLFSELARLGIQPLGSYALYEERTDGQVDVIAAASVSPQTVDAGPTLSIRHLPSVARAATLIHRGSMATLKDSYAALIRWMSEAGEQPTSCSREHYVSMDMQRDPSTWITELQFVLRDA